ncbi:hypothetical protein [Micromonospora sp. ATCC 39149]|uniref:Uncharacterized protein n=1 Tax=Micromonospora carbonacea TaxID=47853 RepID=A0A7D6C5Q2_9ACTN|nr:hypothetical protein [Micromonospora sp. ATCC 39149]QLJ98266.1 hypothetical protein HZU44_26730 [Micromonospora carbonacea]
MRLTVGPLPPAVYWRRRAVVLGAGLLFLIVLLYSCNGAGNTGTTPQSKSTPTPTAAPGAGDPSAAPAPSGSLLSPQTGLPPGGPDGSEGDSGNEGGSGGPSGGDVPAGPGGDAGTCTDAEISVTPVVLPTSAQQGTVVRLQLKIKNRSDRTCSRDVGADFQELFVKSGAEKVWSSDTCGNVKGSDVQSFTPGFERSYQVDWNGRDTSRCKDGLANGQFPPAGAYQVFGRLDTKLSEPVKLSITG